MSHRRRSLIPSTVVAVAALGLLAAGCGGGGSQHVATVASSTTTATTTSQTELGAMVAFSRCMRAHGVPNFPDPQHFAGGNVKLTIHNLTPSQSSLNACTHLLPTNGVSQQTARQRQTQLRDELSFARCMRSHGLTRFPDPTAQGQLTVAMAQAQGIDVHSLTVLRTAEACVPASHGALTIAKVREAINNAGG